MSEEIQWQIDRLDQQVIQLYQQGRYEQAIQPATKACDLARRHLGKEHPDFAASLSNLAVSGAVPRDGQVC